MADSSELSKRLIDQLKKEVLDHKHKIYFKTGQNQYKDSVDYPIVDIGEDMVLVNLFDLPEEEAYKVVEGEIFDYFCCKSENVGHQVYCGLANIDTDNLLKGMTERLRDHKDNKRFNNKYKMVGFLCGKPDYAKNIEFNLDKNYPGINRTNPDGDPVPWGCGADDSSFVVYLFKRN